MPGEKMKHLMFLIIAVGFLGWAFFPETAQSQAPINKDTTQSDTAMKRSDDSKDMGIGPVKNVKLGPIDSKLAAEGKSLFNSNCTACHSLQQKIVGPPLGDITKQRTPEFVMNMILNAPVMEQKDPKVETLVEKYHVNMPNTGLSEKQARAILEYLRSATQKEKTK